MKENKTVTAIVLVAGNSTRYGQNRNKNLEKINNKPVFLYSVEAFEKNKEVDNIMITVKKEEKEIIEDIIVNMKLDKPVEVVIGGASRQQSVYVSLQATNSDIVIIQDGARPAIKQEYITDCIKSIQQVKGCSIAVKSKDTIKITDEKGEVQQTTKRENTWLVQTPQCFERKILLEGHKKYEKEEGITDDCSILEKMGEAVKLIKGDYTNIKLTTIEDLEMLQEFLK